VAKYNEKVKVINLESRNVIDDHEEGEIVELEHEKTSERNQKLEDF
jgi:hypothetical protein